MVADRSLPCLIVYANECNRADCFDWWEFKRETFGSDDGVEYIPLSEIKTWIARTPKRKAPVIDLMPQSYQLLANDDETH